MPYNPYQVHAPGYPDQNDNWYGVPGYGNYSNYLRSVSQPLSLQRLTNISQSMQQQAMPEGNYGTPYTPMVSPLPVNQMPAEVAQSIMDLRNRLLSVPRQRLAESAEPMPTAPEPVPNQPAASTPTGSFTGGYDYGTGGGGGGPTPYSTPTHTAPTPQTYTAPAPTVNPQWHYEPPAGIDYGLYEAYR